MTSDSPREQQLMALVERVEHQFQIVAEGLVSTNERLDRVDRESRKRDQDLDRKIDLMTKTLSDKIDRVEQWLDAKIDGKINGLAQRMDEGFAILIREVAVVVGEVRATNARLDQTNERLDQLIARFDAHERAHAP